MSRVVEKKLGREKALGQVNHLNPRSKIEIDPRQTPRSYLGTLLHEKIHLLHPEWSETKVIKEERALLKLLWDNNYRKVSQ